MQNCQMEKSAAVARRSKLNARRSEVSVKSGDNLFHQLIDAELQRLDWAVIELNRKIEVCKVASKMLEDYESSVKEAPVLQWTFQIRTGAF